MRLGAKFCSAAFATLALTAYAAPAGAEEAPWKFPVLVMDPPRKTGLDPFTGKEQLYTALAKSEVSKKWNICALFPHTTNDVLRAYIYGTVEEAKRLGAKLTIYDAGGYGKVDKQLAQFDDCLALGADVVLMFAVSTSGLNQKIDQTRANGTKVLDLNVGVGTQADARVVVPTKFIGQAVGTSLAAKHPKGSGKATVVLMPGPAGVSWAEDVVLGFKETITGSDLALEKVVYGQPGRLDQQPLVEDVLTTYPNLTYIVGMGTSIEAALNTLREQGRLGKIGLYATFITPDIIEPIRKGDVSAAVVENSVIINKLAVDMAVRLLEKKLTVKDAIPSATLINSKNVDDVAGPNFAPKDWKPQFTVD